MIDSILKSDRKAPRKQRHTARRIFDRIRAEVPGCTPAERTVRQYVERRKHELGLIVHERFVPQSYDWGVEAQIDWYESYADIDGEPVKLQVFSMRSMASGAAFSSELTARFIAFRSQWQYRAEFCTPSEGHEKGGVEGEVGYFRRNNWSPCRSRRTLNRKLLADCRAGES